MIFRKRNIINLLFLIYFLLYVVSPFCYAEDKLSENIAITHAAKYDIKKIRVIWELILSKLSQKENAYDSRSGMQFFFIKKARAVLSSNNTIKAEHSESDVSLVNDFFQIIGSITFSAVFTEADPQRGFYSSFSGLSPPRV